MITEQKEYIRFYNIVNEYLESKHLTIERNIEHSMLQWVVDMCTDIYTIIKEERDDVTLEDVISADAQAAGHIDYYRKFPLYCYELLKHGRIGI